MLHVESDRACEGTQGEYKLIAHYLASWRIAKFVELKLKGSTTAIESHLGLPTIDDPLTALALAENVPGTQQQTTMRRLERPAITTVLRICNRATHADGRRSSRDTHRRERAAAVIWVPEGAGRVRIIPKKTELGAHNIGTTWATNQYTGELSPVVSVPLTTEEKRRFEHQSTAEVINALPSTRADNQIFVVLHSNEDSSPTEQIYTFPYPVATMPQ